MEALKVVIPESALDAAIDPLTEIDLPDGGLAAIGMVIFTATAVLLVKRSAMVPTGQLTTTEVVLLPSGEGVGVTVQAAPPAGVMVQGQLVQVMLA